MHALFLDKFYIAVFAFSFGELSFRADFNHSKRAASVISDGNHGRHRSEKNDANFAVLLLIPERAYMVGIQ